MWDVHNQRRAVMNEMRQMAARPFATVELQIKDAQRPNEEPSAVSIIVLLLY